MGRLGIAVAILLVTGSLALAEEATTPTTISSIHLEAALEAAGDNRQQLQAVLDHYANDPQRRAAAEFLISNMPGHGYIVTHLRDKQGNIIDYDPLDYPQFKAALAALDELEKKHGQLEFSRDEKVEDVKTITADFLKTHIDLAFEAWERSGDRRVSFATFLNYILPYRGSQEPLDSWMGPLMRRWAGLSSKPKFKDDLKGLYKHLCKQCSQRVRFNERYYLHPTDQGFTEMGRSGQGRCEDITNMQTYAARSLALATAADYTPAWAHRDNNHAWNVLLDKAGRGFHKGNAHAAKVYRKTFALQRDNLAFRLPEGRKAPNRFLASETYIDVTDQYAPTTDVTVTASDAAGTERFAYLCVFNGGSWTAIHWGPIDEGRVTFDRMGRNIVYLPAVHVNDALVPIAPPPTRPEGRNRSLASGDRRRNDRDRAWHEAGAAARGHARGRAARHAGGRHRVHTEALGRRLGRRAAGHSRRRSPALREAARRRALLAHSQSAAQPRARLHDRERSPALVVA